VIWLIAQVIDLIQNLLIDQIGNLCYEHGLIDGVGNFSGSDFSPHKSSWSQDSWSNNDWFCQSPRRYCPLENLDHGWCYMIFRNWYSAHRGLHMPHIWFQNDCSEGHEWSSRWQCPLGRSPRNSRVRKAEYLVPSCSFCNWEHNLRCRHWCHWAIILKHCVIQILYGAMPLLGHRH
jgi:hypothetical protein